MGTLGNKWSNQSSGAPGSTNQLSGAPDGEPIHETIQRVKQLGIPNQLSGAPECKLSGALDLSSQVYFLRSLPQSPSADHTVPTTCGSPVSAQCSVWAYLL